MSATIMVVDDSLMVRQQVSAALADAGFTVIEATDGLDALHKLESTVPDLIVLDLNMPNLNGLELLKRIREKPTLSNVPVVMLTTEGQPKLMQEAKGLGAKGWIIKPFKAEMLVRAVEKLTQVPGAPRAGS